MKRIDDLSDEELADYIHKIELNLCAAISGMLEIADNERRDRAFVRQLKQEAEKHELLH